MTRQINAGGVPIGGGAPVSIQSMTNTPTHDVEATLAQVRALAAAGWYLSLTAAALWFPLSGIYLLLMGFSVPCLLWQFLIRTVLERFGGAENIDQ